jgi:hypothetical protein
MNIVVCCRPAGSEGTRQRANVFSLPWRLYSLETGRLFLDGCRARLLALLKQKFKTVSDDVVLSSPARKSIHQSLDGHFSFRKSVNPMGWFECSAPPTPTLNINIQTCATNLDTSSPPLQLFYMKNHRLNVG